MVDQDLGTLVCAADGVRIARSRAGRWVHTDSLPEFADPDHEIDPVPAASFGRAHAARLDLREAAVDMLRHHDTLHPGSDCAFARRLGEAMRAG